MGGFALNGCGCGLDVDWWDWLDQGGWDGGGNLISKRPADSPHSRTETGGGRQERAPRGACDAWQPTTGSKRGGQG